MCYDAPDPPDMTGAIEGSKEVADMQLKFAREQADWAKQQDSMNRDVLNRVLDIQLPAMADQASNAREDRQRYEDKFRPIEDDLVNEFNTFNSPERQATERGRAMADVGSAFDAQRRNALQRLESYGVDPSQTRNAALDIGMRTQQAAAQAAAATGATRNVEDKSRALRADAINIGKGLPSQVASSYGQAVAAGSAGVGGANQTTGTSAGAFGNAGAALQGAQGGYGQVGALQTQNFGNQNAAWGNNVNQAMGGLGAVAGIAGMFMADGGDVDGKRKAITFDETGAPMFESEPGMIDYGEGDGSGIDDKVPIMASTEEYIIPADVVRAKGVEFFDKLVAKYHTPAEEQKPDEYTKAVSQGRAINPTPQRRMG